MLGLEALVSRIRNGGWCVINGYPGKLIVWWRCSCDVRGIRITIPLTWTSKTIRVKRHGISISIFIKKWTFQFTVADHQWNTCTCFSYFYLSTKLFSRTNLSRKLIFFITIFLHFIRGIEKIIRETSRFSSIRGPVSAFPFNRQSPCEGEKRNGSKPRVAHRGVACNSTWKQPLLSTPFPALCRATPSSRVPLRERRVFFVRSLMTALLLIPNPHPTFNWTCTRASSLVHGREQGE